MFSLKVRGALTLLFVGAVLSPASAQVSVTYTGDTPGSVSNFVQKTVKDKAVSLGAIDISNTNGDSTTSIHIGLLLGKDCAKDLLKGDLPGAAADCTDVSVIDTTRLFNISGGINSYVVNASTVPFTRDRIATVRYTDMLRITSPVPATVQIPFSVNASFVEGLSFADPATSPQLAMAQVTATLGGSSATAGGNLMNPTGGLPVTGGVSDSNFVTLSVGAGITLVPLDVSGMVEAKTTIKGLSPLGLLAGAGNTGVLFGDSASPGIVVNNFTGLNGASLPNGLSIEGMTTGITYIGAPSAPTPAPGSLLIALTGFGAGFLKLRLAAIRKAR